MPCNRILRTSCSAILCVLTVLHAANAQEQDFGWWYSASVQHRLTGKWEVSLAEQVRTNRNLETVDLCFTQLGVQYSIRKNLRAAFSYRFIQRNELEFWSYRHGIYADIAWRKKLKPFTLSVRGRLQGRAEDLQLGSESIGPDWFFRTKAGLQYSTGRRWTPHASCESFLLVRSLDSPERNGDITRFRYEAGIEYEFNRRHAVDVSYMLQHNRSPMLDEYIISTGYAFSF